MSESDETLAKQNEGPTAAQGALESYRNKSDNTVITSYFVRPKNNLAPAILLLRGVAGPNSGYEMIADSLASEGFAALVHHWQTRGDDPDDSLLLQDIEAALEFLQQQPSVQSDRIVVFGYCRGGGQALLAAAEFPAVRAVVAFHGFARRSRGADATHCDPIDVVPHIKQPVLLLHGEDDKISPVSSMRDLSAALQAASVLVHLHTYTIADHGFAVSTHKGFQRTAAEDSYARAVEFVWHTLR